MRDFRQNLQVEVVQTKLACETSVKTGNLKDENTVICGSRPSNTAVCSHCFLAVIVFLQSVIVFLQSLFSCSHLSLRSLFFAVILLFSHCMPLFFAVIVLCSHGALQPWFFAVMVLCSVGNRCIDETSTKTFVSRKYI